MNQNVSRALARADRPRARRSVLAARVMGALGLAGTAAALATVSRQGGEAAAAPVTTSRAALPPSVAPAANVLLLDDTLAGRSRKLRARFLAPANGGGAFAYLRRLLGDSATAQPGVYTVAQPQAGRPFSFISLVPFTEKVNGRIGTYRIGFWPSEKGRALAGKYGNPAGFIKVTRENRATPISEHFKLADFLTKDQVQVWPKYLVLDEALVDKLELVLDDLRARGYDAKRLHVMSGFRTPQYNQNGGNTAGRADLSRHQYGDAADVWVENGAGRMADLNQDGRVDARDAAIVAESADRVERAHPELAGGVGIYKAGSGHGPFVHIDTRGKRARWGHA